MARLGGDPVLPSPSSELRIRRDTEVARGEFRKRRLDDPLADYEQKFPSAKAAADVVIDALGSLLAQPTDKHLVAGIVADKEQYSALRSLAATPISADDLQTLLRSSITKTSLRDKQVLADELSHLLRTCLDPQRFPWVAAARPATAAELEAAKLATAVLTAVSAVQAGRRGDERKALEGRVQEVLSAAGFVPVA